MSDEAKWSVFRMDDNGNVFEIVKNKKYEEAAELSREYNRRGHKQLYWVEESSCLRK